MTTSLNITVPTHPIKRPSLVGEELEGMDEVVYVDTENGTNVSLNILGATILELCDGSHTEKDIVHLILENLSGDAELVAKDVQQILMEYAAYGLFVKD